MAAPEPSPAGFGSALEAIVRGLRRQPPLLYGLGAGILIIGLAGAVGGIAADQLWLLVGALVLLVLAGLGAWLVVAPRSARHRVRGRDIVAERQGRVLDVEVGPEGGALDIEAERDVKASDGGEIGVLRRSDKVEPPPDRDS